MNNIPAVRGRCYGWLEYAGWHHPGDPVRFLCSHAEAYGPALPSPASQGSPRGRLSPPLILTGPFR